jgi:hypothetical protein
MMMEQNSEDAQERESIRSAFLEEIQQQQDEQHQQQQLFNQQQQLSQ